MSGLDLAVSEATLAAFLLALARTAGFVAVAPPFNTRAIPVRVRAVVALALAVPVSVFARGSAPSLTGSSIVVETLVQLFAGLTFGFVVQLAVAAVQVVGDLIDVVGGFTVTMAMDPLLMVQTSVMGRLHQLLAVTLLFAGDGHLMVVHGLARGMEAMPVARLDLEDVGRVVTEGMADMFLAAVEVAAPVIAVMLVADVALALLSRAAPALNAFALSFPLKLLLSLLLVGLVVTQVPRMLTDQVETAVVSVLELAGAR